MGVEDFQVILTCDSVKVSNVTESVKCIQNLHIDRKTQKIAGEEYFIIDDGKHLIELEVSPIKNVKTSTRISCRFALCHPISIDEVFYNFIKKIGQQFKMIVKVPEDTPTGFLDKFYPPDYIGLNDTLKKAIEQKRRYWIQDFGSETLSLTTSGALEKYLLNQ